MTVIPTAATPVAPPAPTPAPTHPAYLWRNGELVPWADAQVHASTLGWSTMAAVFEGIKAYVNPQTGDQWGWQFAEHFARFAQSMRLQRMRPEFSPQELADASVALLKANGHVGDTYVRPLAWLSDVSWFTDGLDSRTSIVIVTEPFRSHLQTGRTWNTCVSSWIRVGDNQLSPRVKCISNYQNSRLALIEAKKNGFDQPILLNLAGKVTEGPASCLFMVRDGVFVTPSLTSGVLESITRTALIRLAREELGMEVQEREIDRTELYVADEMFFCGTGAELMPIGAIDHFQVGSGGVGPLTARLERVFHDVVRGIHPGYGHWRRHIDHA